jgi:hypothetical protein
MGDATEDERSRLVYLPPQGVALGAVDDRGVLWMQRLRLMLQEHKPAIVILDSLASTVAADVNDNTEAAAAMATLKQLASEHSCLIFFIAHDRKSTGGPAGHRLMGARQWANQLDAQMSMEVIGPRTNEPMEDGLSLLSTPVAVTWPKDRDGVPRAERTGIVIESIMEGNTLLDMEVRAEGDLLDDAPNGPAAAESLLTQVLAALEERGAPMGRSEIARAVNVAPDANRFRSPSPWGCARALCTRAAPAPRTR